MTYLSHEVFGISTKILEPSYVNRGNLDSRIQTLLKRNLHIAIRGESKCGKSWFRQKNLPTAIVVQCRLKKSVPNLFEDALSQLGLSLVEERTDKGAIQTSLQADTEAAMPLLAKIKAKLGIKIDASTEVRKIPVGQNLDNLRFVSELINESGRRLVIEDFHYLPPDERRTFATDLKALWDYGTYVVIIGIWSENNLMLHLNNDLSGRVEELSIYWSSDELKEVLSKGASALNVSFASQVSKRLVEDAFGTVGILQGLTLALLDEAGVEATQTKEKEIGSLNQYQDVALHYADQMNAVYQTFASRVAKGIRQRKNATGIYAHMLKVVLEAPDQDLIDGLHTDKIFSISSKREPRVQKPNLRSVLSKIDSLQVDDEGRGLIITYDATKDEVFVVDKQVFFYRQYATVRWPWERIIEEISEDSSRFEKETAE